MDSCCGDGDGDAEAVVEAVVDDDNGDLVPAW